jgi:thioredoxin reductase
VAGVDASKATCGSKTSMRTTQTSLDIGGVLGTHLLFSTFKGATCTLDVDLATEFGTIAVDEHFRTSESSIFAVGDVIGGMELTGIWS